jgi:hypothetical protein
LRPNYSNICPGLRSYIEFGQVRAMNFHQLVITGKHVAQQGGAIA